MSTAYLSGISHRTFFGYVKLGRIPKSVIIIVEYVSWRWLQTATRGALWNCLVDHLNSPSDLWISTLSPTTIWLGIAVGIVAVTSKTAGTLKLPNNWNTTDFGSKIESMTELLQLGTKRIQNCRKTCCRYINWNISKSVINI